MGGPTAPVRGKIQILEAVAETVEGGGGCGSAPDWPDKMKQNKRMNENTRNRTIGWIPSCKP
ncbi:hypothetical protein [Leptospirillum ferrooxidans]|uniref:Uncharacterized protein n=1 Tax=Leptospirillum ferrooxidans (strain C2-3) TaxID=1162668 RepID=I0INK3_LEPFC|nr:hypothetical protein [Leptospirillum ferrooxidans]BAM06852.1 hypothetical protein LFE_1161 [Leptospirillum ferrooxidans C2-3]